MRAMVIRRHGGPEVFEEVELPTPEVRVGTVLIKVHGSSVNPLDVKMRKTALPFSRGFPEVLHGDVAGVVEAVGNGVTHLRVGDEVFGCAGGVKGTEGGALADFMLADADLIARKPSTLSWKEAGAMPLVAITAWGALVEKLNIKPGDNLLVHGATGGVGHIAIQLGKVLGANVYTTAGSEGQLATAKALGADVGINYRTESVESYVEKYTDNRGFDAIFDTVGGVNLQNSFKAIKWNGAIACIATGGNHDLSPLYLKGGSLHSVLMLIPMLSGRDRKRHGAILNEITKFVEAGKIRPLLAERSFAFSDVGLAHDYLESGNAAGKVALINS